MAAKSSYPVAVSLLLASEGVSIQFKTLNYDGPNGSLFISILLHNSEFRICTTNFGIVKYI